MDALPYYKWYWIDYRANRKVQRMSWQARGLYRELLDEFWSEGFLPSGMDELAEICGCDPTSFLLYWPEIEPCWEFTHEGLVNPKMEEQRTSTDVARAAKARAGAKGGKVSNSATRSKQTEASAKQVLTEAKQVQAQPDIAEQSRALAEQSKSRALRPEVLARQVQDRAHAHGDKTLQVLTSVCRAELEIGIPPDVLLERLAESWLEHQSSAAELTFMPPAHQFYGDGLWRDKKTWNWRKNGNFTGKTESSLNAAQRAIEAIENRNAASAVGDSPAGQAGRGGLPSVRSRPRELSSG